MGTRSGYKRGGIMDSVAIKDGGVPQDSILLHHQVQCAAEERKRSLHEVKIKQEILDERTSNTVPDKYVQRDSDNKVETLESEEVVVIDRDDVNKEIPGKTPILRIKVRRESKRTSTSTSKNRLYGITVSKRRKKFYQDIKDIREFTKNLENTNEHEEIYRKVEKVRNSNSRKKIQTNINEKDGASNKNSEENSIGKLQNNKQNIHREEDRETNKVQHSTQKAVDVPIDMEMEALEEGTQKMEVSDGKEGRTSAILDQTGDNELQLNVGHNTSDKENVNQSVEGEMDEVNGGEDVSMDTGDNTNKDSNQMENERLTGAGDNLDVVNNTSSNGQRKENKPSSTDNVSTDESSKSPDSMHPNTKTKNKLMKYADEKYKTLL